MMLFTGSVTFLTATDQTLSLLQWGFSVWSITFKLCLVHSTDADSQLLSTDSPAPDHPLTVASSIFLLSFYNTEHIATAV